MTAYIVLVMNGGALITLARCANRQIMFIRSPKVPALRTSTEEGRKNGEKEGEKPEE